MHGAHRGKQGKQARRNGRPNRIEDIYFGSALLGPCSASQRVSMGAISNKYNFSNQIQIVPSNTHMFDADDPMLIFNLQMNL